VAFAFYCLPSNLFNVRQRYELVPYYYSLAHRAHLFAEPVFPPLFYYYPTDAHVRSIGHEKMIGRDILVGVVAALGQTQRDVYLPADTWINYFTNGQCCDFASWHSNFQVLTHESCCFLNSTHFCFSQSTFKVPA
jgi:alpha-glucosidase